MKRGKPVCLLEFYLEQSKVQTMPIVRRVEENIKSECRAVMARIRIEILFDAKAGRLVCGRSRARDLAKPMKGEKQMTEEFNNLTGAAPNLEWHSINWKEVQTNVNRLQVRIVKALKENRWN